MNLVESLRQNCNTDNHNIRVFVKKKAVYWFRKFSRENNSEAIQRMIDKGTVKIYK